MIPLYLGYQGSEGPSAVPNNLASEETCPRENLQLLDESSSTTRGTTTTIIKDDTHTLQKKTPPPPTALATQTRERHHLNPVFYPSPPPTSKAKHHAKNAPTRRHAEKITQTCLLYSSSPQAGLSVNAAGAGLRASLKMSWVVSGTN